MQQKSPKLFLPIFAYLPGLGIVVNWGRCRRSRRRRRRHQAMALLGLAGCLLADWLPGWLLAANK